MGRFVVEEFRVFVEADDEDKAPTETMSTLDIFGTEIFLTHREVQYSTTQED